MTGSPYRDSSDHPSGNGVPERDGVALEPGIAARRWRSWMNERLAPLGLTEAKWLILRCLAEAGGSLPQRRLVEQTDIANQNLVKVLGELEQAGVVERRDSQIDRRGKMVSLTEDAQPLLGKIEYWTSRLWEEMLAGISDQEVAVFRRVMAQISRNARSRHLQRFSVGPVPARAARH